MPDKKPSIHQLKPVPGYEYVLFESAVAAPENNHDNTDSTKADAEETINGTLGNNSPPRQRREDVEDALRQFLKEKKHLKWRNFGKAHLGQITCRNILHYSLETFTEKRTVKWEYKPVREDNALDGMGSVPLPWEMELDRTVSGLFQNGQAVMEVPNSSQIHRCFECGGLGRTRCEDCKGDGGGNCHFCNGSGLLRAGHGSVKCKDCDGRGFKKCKKCKSRGQVSCDVCKKKCRLRFYLQLTVEHINHRKNELSPEVPDLPRKDVVDSEGEVLWESVGNRVQPVRDFQDDVLRSASEKFIKDHEAALANERMIKQRQRIRCVPVAEVNYTHGRDRGRFFVCGLNRKIHFPKNEKPHVCSVM